LDAISRKAVTCPVCVATTSTPTPEQQNFVLINAGTLQKVQRMIAGCETCSEDAEIPFDNIGDRLTGSDPSVTDYVLELPVTCLQCRAAVTEKDLVCDKDS
jgi:hypothetical protein